MNRKTVELDQLYYSLTPRLADASGWVTAPDHVPKMLWTRLTDDLADQLEDLR